MKRFFIAATAVLFIFCFTGCWSIVVEENEIPIGSRESLILVNPVGAVLSDLSALAEITYEEVVSEQDSSTFTLGYGKDSSDGNDTTILYIMAGGRYYPMSEAPSGFFIHGDIGFAQYTYNLTDNRDTQFTYGMSVGYKYITGMFIGELGAGYMKTEFIEDEQDYTPILKFQIGMKF